MLQISTAELAAKAEETRGQLRHLDQQVGHSTLHDKTLLNPITIDCDTHLSILHPLADVGLNITELVLTMVLVLPSDLSFLHF